MLGRSVARGAVYCSREEKEEAEQEQEELENVLVCNEEEAR